MEHDLGSEADYNRGVTYGTGGIFSASSMVNAALRPVSTTETGNNTKASVGLLQAHSVGLSSPAVQPVHRRSHSDPVFLAGIGVKEFSTPHETGFNPSHMGTAVVGFQSVANHALRPSPAAIFAANGPKVKLENHDNNNFHALEQTDSNPFARNGFGKSAGQSFPAANRFDVGTARDAERTDRDVSFRPDKHDVGASAMSSPTELTGGFCSLPASTASRNAARVSRTDNDEAAEQESDSQPASSAKVSPSNIAKSQPSRKRGGFNGRTNEELSQLDPKRVRRILANRESAARSKERKMRYTNELDSRLKTLTATCERLTANLNSLRQEHLDLYEQAQQYQAEMEQLEGYLDHLRTTNKDYTKRLTALQARIGKQSAQQMGSRSRVDSSRSQFVQPDHVITPVKEYPDWYPSSGAGSSWHHSKYSSPATATQLNFRSAEPVLPSFPAYDTPVRHEPLHRHDSATTRHDPPARQASTPAPAPAPPPPGESHNPGTSSYLNSGDLYDNYDSWSYGDNKLMPEWEYRPDSASTLHAPSPTPLSLLDDHMDEHTGDWPDCKIDLPLSLVDDFNADCGGLSKPLGGSGLFPGLQFA